MTPTRLVSPGPVAAAFMRSRAFIAVIIGPVGSGKTMAALQKGLRNGALQGYKLDEAGRKRRRARFGVIRESYPSLDANTLPSWFNIVARDKHFSGKAPYKHSVQKILKRDPATNDPIDILDIDVEFRAIGEQGVEAATRGWEVNSVMVDEADVQPPDLVSFLSGRVGRFSNLNASLVVEPQIILSLNAPYTDNHIYKLAIENSLGAIGTPELHDALAGRPLIETFIQPGGRDPKAENIHNLPGGRGYYVLQAAANAHRPGYVARMVDNKFVPMQHGQPVYADFTYGDHVATAPIEWNPRRKLIVGIDQGLFAAAAFTQRTSMGELRTLDEVVVFKEEGETLLKIGPTAFGRMVKARLVERFSGIKAEQLRFVADPAAFTAADRSDDEHDWLLAFQAALGFKVHRAKTNKEALRLEAVRKAQSDRNGYLIDARCKHLIRAHLGGYRYRKADLRDAETRGHLEIADTIYTHVADAEQYAAVEGDHVLADIRGKSRAGSVVVNDSDYDVLRRG